MGIVNVTPDSFFDGGPSDSPEKALIRADAMIAEGAVFIDVGGESTRPGADPVPLEEEIRRVVPVVKALAARRPEIPISIDTTKAEVARRCLEAGARIINDVSALQGDPDMARVAREYGAVVILMHRQGEARTMQTNPLYTDVVQEIKTFFQERLAWAGERGIAPDRLWLDPGIGFGKTVEHNLDILRRLPELAIRDRPLVVGTSRKSFIGKILGSETDPRPPEDRLEGTLATHLWAADRGARVLRVHDVAATRKILTVWHRLGGKGP
jgi:dihydropteroate synthase